MKKIAIFASGAGSNAQKIIDYSIHKSALFSVAIIVCNKPGAGVIDIAINYGIEVLMIEKVRFSNDDGYASFLKNKNIDAIILAGFLWKIPEILIQSFQKKIINIHPALLPKYGGKGMYGMKVHEAVINAKEKLSGITIHLVDEHYDHGKIIFQTTCEIEEADTAETLAKKVHQLEHNYFAKVVDEFVGKME